MPAPDGLEVCRRIRAVSVVPIIMLTVRDQVFDKVRGLDVGADDYLTKPFDPIELLARMRALLRRASSVPPQGASERFEVGDVSLDTGSREVRVRGEVVPLTSTEYRLLEALARAGGATVSHRDLLKRVWGPEYPAETGYVKASVRRLRRKLGDDADPPRVIQSDWGRGYRLAVPPHATNE